MLHVTSIAAFIANLIICILLSYEVFFLNTFRAFRIFLHYSLCFLQILTFFVLIPRLDLSSWGDYFLLLSIFINLGILLIQKNVKYNLITLVSASFAFVLYASSSLLLHLPAAASMPKSAVLFFHIIPSLVSMAALLLLLVFSLLYLVKKVSLKRKKFFAFVSLPALERLEKNLRVGIVIAYLMTSLAILSGVVFSTLSKESFIADRTAQFSVLSWSLLALLSYFNHYQLLSTRRLATTALTLTLLYFIGIFLILVVYGNQVHA